MVRTADGRLAGKKALVTGGSRGIGAAVVRRLVDEGATVVITRHDAPKAVLISVNEFNQALKQQQDQMRTLLGRNFDPQMFDTAEFRQSVLEQLVNTRLLILQAASSGFAVTDKQLAENIGAISVFQDEGKFSKTRYEGLLKQQGYTPVVFEGKMRQDLMVQELRDAVSKTPLVASVKPFGFAPSIPPENEYNVVNVTSGAFDEITVSVAPALMFEPNALVTTTVYVAASAGETLAIVRALVVAPEMLLLSVKFVPLRCQ